jgi:hypothetical protein
VEITVLIGYISVSTNDQNIDLQRDALQSANCEQIFADKITGTSIERPGLNRALRALSPGDTLVVWKLDRLGRSVRHLISLVEDLKNRGIHFRSLTDSIDTSADFRGFSQNNLSIHPCARTTCPSLRPYTEKLKYEFQGFKLRSSQPVLTRLLLTAVLAV